jgi:hypothetical protein
MVASGLSERGGKLRSGGKKDCELRYQYQKERNWQCRYRSLG